MALSMRERQAITREMARRYKRAGKRERGLMLDELCALVGYNRCYAARRLREQVRGPTHRRLHRRGRQPACGPELIAPLAKVWATLGGICGKRLVASMARTVSALKRHGELELTGGACAAAPGGRLQGGDPGAPRRGARMTPAPLRLRRVFKERLWAGRQMASVFGYDMPDGDVGECWSVGARPDSPPTVVGGPHDAETLLTVREEDRVFFGDDPRPSFPLLVKFVDAREGSRCRSTPVVT